MKLAAISLTLAIASAIPASAGQLYHNYPDEIQRQSERQRDEGQRLLDRQTDSYGWNRGPDVYWSYDEPTPAWEPDE